jgi:CDP-diglyceride synthetase
MDHHTVALISLVGTCLDVLGTLYLAYDLLGGQHGPLRLITRIVTYSAVFGIGYGIGLNWFFGIVCGLAIGATIAIELNRAARGLEHYSLPWESLFSAIRGAALAVGLWPMTGVKFAVAFGALNTLGQIVAYTRGTRPAMEYMASGRPRLTKRQFLRTVERAIGYLVAALVCSAFVRHLEHPWAFAVRVGLTVGVVTGLGQLLNPYIEYYADHLPERRLGAFGIVVILIGFAMQSFQYWLAVLDVKLR